MVKPEASVSRWMGLAGLKCVSTRAFVKLSWRCANNWIMAVVGIKCPKKRLFIPPFSLAVIGLAIHKKLLIKHL
jgi:hypothetical protein